MNHIKSYIILAVLMIFAVNTGFSQEGQYIEVRDLETWSSCQVDFQLNKAWTIGAEGQMRLDKNSSELKSLFSELTTEYKISKNFELGTGLRFLNKNDNEGSVQGNEHYFRYHLDATYKHSISRFDLKYRFKYTTMNEIGVSVDDGDIPIQYFRFKTSLGYNIKNWKLDPEFAGEIFNKYEKDGQSNGFDHYRLSFGTSYNINGYGKIGVYYVMEKEISSFYPKTTNIIQLKYKYTFKK